MAVRNCRADKCGMQFANEYLQKQHEGMFHKNLINETIEKILEKINLTNSTIDLQKKVFYTSVKKLSYEDISKLNRDSEDFEYVKNVFKIIIEKWFADNPEKNISEFLRTLQFHIS